MKICNSILECIGNTPMVKLNRIGKGLPANILAKCEFLNPSGSIKDRIAIKMIQEAEKSGKLSQGGVVTESSTGNTATALSFVCAVKGYKAVMCMPKGWVTEDRTKIIKSYGAEILEVDPGEDIQRELKGKSVHGGVVELIPRIKALEMEQQNENTWWARQALNPDNVLAHKETTGREILDQTDGKVDALVCSVGTGGSLLGIAEALLEVNPELKIYAVEPESSSLFQMAPEIEVYMKKYNIPGIVGWIILEITKKKIVEQTFLVRNEDAVAMAHRLSCEEGLFCGMSSGANVFISIQVARMMAKGQNVVTVLPDSRDRYFTSETYTT